MVLRMTGSEAGDERHHDDGERAPPEDHQEQRIHQHQRRRGEGGDPGLAGKPEQLHAVEKNADGDAEERQQDARGKAFPRGEQETVRDVLLDDDAFEAHRDLGRHRHDEAVDDADADQDFDRNQHQHERAEADDGRGPAVRADCGRGVHGRCLLPSPLAGEGRVGGREVK